MMRIHYRQNRFSFLVPISFSSSQVIFSKSHIIELRFGESFGILTEDSISEDNSNNMNKSRTTNSREPPQKKNQRKTRKLE